MGRPRAIRPVWPWGPIIVAGIISAQSQRWLSRCNCMISEYCRKRWSYVWCLYGIVWDWPSHLSDLWPLPPNYWAQVVNNCCLPLCVNVTSQGLHKSETKIHPCPPYHHHVTIPVVHNCAPTINNNLEWVPCVSLSKIAYFSTHGQNKLAILQIFANSLFKFSCCFHGIISLI